MSIKKKTIIVNSTGHSGGGAVYDYLRSRNDCLAPFNGEEFRIINDPHGIENLYQSFFKNFSFNNSSEALNNFTRYCYALSNQKLFKNNKFIDKKKFLNLTDLYLKKIIFLSYEGVPYFKRITISSETKLFLKLKNVFSKDKDYLKSYNKMCLPVNEKKFLNETKDYLKKLTHSKLIGSKNIVLDHATNFWQPNIAEKFFDNLKIIRVTRDPRSIFYSMKLRKSRVYPGHDIDVFIKWYKRIMEYRIINKKNNILDIKFEQFLENFKENKTKLEKFLNLKKNNKINFDINFSRKNLYKAKLGLKNKELFLIEKKLKRYLQW